jgi:hypothetical protein
MIFLNSVTSIKTKYFAFLIWHIDDNLFCWKSVAFINDVTHNIYVVFFGWPRDVVSFLKLEWRKWRHRNAENEQMDGEKKEHTSINPLKPELNPMCYLLSLLGAHHFLHVSRIRVKLLTLRRLTSYIYGAPILDVSRSHTTTQHSR